MAVNWQQNSSFIFFLYIIFIFYGKEKTNFFDGPGANVFIGGILTFYQHPPKSRMYSRGNGDEQHVHGPEEDVEAVAQPDVGQCDHDEDARRHQEGEDAQRQLPPHGPAHWDVSHDQCCQSSCGRAKCKKDPIKPTEASDPIISHQHQAVSQKGVNRSGWSFGVLIKL